MKLLREAEDGLTEGGSLVRGPGRTESEAIQCAVVVRADST